MGGAGGVGADQDLWRVRVIRARAVLRWQRIECLAQHGDVIDGGVTADIAARSSPARASPAAMSGRSKNISSE